MKVGIPITFDDNILDEETRNKIKPLIDFINTSNKTIVQALQGKLSLQDNISCTLKYITVKHGIAQNISGGGVGSLIISSSSASPIDSYSLKKTNGGIDCTVNFLDPTTKGEPTQSDLTILIFNN